MSTTLSPSVFADLPDEQIAKVPSAALRQVLSRAKKDETQRIVNGHNSHNSHSDTGGYVVGPQFNSHRNHADSPG